MKGTVYLTLTDQCNLACPFCFYLQDPKRITPGTLRVKRIKDLMGEARDLGFREVSFTGGEPLLYKDLTKLIKHAKTMGFKTTLSTNGLLLNQEMALKLKKAGLEDFFLSITSQYFLGGNKFNKSEWVSRVTARVEILRQAGLENIYLVFVITKQTTKYLQTALKFLKTLDLKIQVQPAFISSQTSSLSLWDLEEKEWKGLEPKLKRWGKAFGREKSAIVTLNYYQRLKQGRPSFCHFSEEDVVIDPNGDIYPCFHRRDLKLGNIYKNKLATLLSSLKKNDREKMVKADCFNEQCISLF